MGVVCLTFMAGCKITKFVKVSPLKVSLYTVGLLVQCVMLGNGSHTGTCLIFVWNQFH